MLSSFSISHSRFTVASGPIITYQPQNLSLPVGSTATFTCVTTQTFDENYDMSRGHNDISVSWYKDGASISANQSIPSSVPMAIRQYMIEPDDALVIPAITPMDDAQYTCVAFNQHGYASASAFLNVQGVSTGRQLMVQISPQIHSAALFTI